MLEELKEKVFHANLELVKHGLVIFTIHYYHIFGLHIIITYTTGFDYYQSAFTVDSRDIAILNW